MDKKFWSVFPAPGIMRINQAIVTWLARIGISLLMTVLPLNCWAAKVSLNKITIEKFPNYSRLIFTVSASNKYHVFLLANPNRLVVDFDKAALHTDIKNLNLTSTVLKSARSGRPVPSMLRIVFDLAAPVKIKSMSATESNDSQLVVDVFPKQSSAPPVTQNVVSQQSAPVLSTKPSTEKMAITNVKPEKVLTALDETDLKKIPTPVKPKATVMKEFDIVEMKKQPRMQAVEIMKQRKLIIVIDAGHGGKDPGTVGQQGTKEKDVVLKIALRLAELIDQEPGLRAALTRRGDYFVSLKDRLRIARKSKADLFLAIHADSYFDSHSTGASVYALSQHGASSMAARWLADRENHSELGGVDLNGLEDHSYLLRSVLIDLAETATIVDSVKLGNDMLASLESVTSLHYNRVEQAPFMVLKSPDIPSVLVEMGFLSNNREEDHLRDAEYRDKLAHALLAGIHQYVATHPMMASNSRPDNKEIPI